MKLGERLWPPMHVVYVFLMDLIGFFFFFRSFKPSGKTLSFASDARVYSAYILIELNDCGMIHSQFAFHYLRRYV